MRYGSGSVSFTLPANAAVERIEPQWGEPPGGDPVTAALAQPIGCRPLRELAAGVRSAVILVSDGTRLCPTALLLPPLLAELQAAGLDDRRIRIVVALGIHRRHTEGELAELVGENIYRRVAVVNHSSLEEDCVQVGVTSRGTPVALNRDVVRAQLRIATGNIEPHRLAGVSGGCKALMPGVASRSTIEANHALSRLAKAQPGSPDNPVCADLEEAQKLLPVHFLLNVIVDQDRRIAAAFAGDITEAHRAGVERVHELFGPIVQGAFDLVIASAGGHPKDAQLYQAAKTLQNAAAIARPGCPIVLVARCEEGFGDSTMQDWLTHMPSREAIRRRLDASFVLGAHKIEQLDAVTGKHPVYLHSDMPAALVELAGMRPAASLQQTIDALAGSQPLRVGVMPYGAITFPRKEDDA